MAQNKEMPMMMNRQQGWLMLGSIHVSFMSLIADSLGMMWELILC